MKQKRKDVGLHVKNMHKNTSTDINPNTNATSTQASNPTVPLVLSLVVCFLFAIGIIIAGYFHGKMHLLTVLKNAFSS